MSRTSPPSRWQFSLRWLLGAVAFIAVLLGLLSFSAGQLLVGLCLFIMLRGIVPTAALVAAIFARGDLQAFAVGALVPCISVIASGDEPWGRWGPVFGVVLQLATIALCGGTAVVVRRRIAPPGKGNQ